MPKYTIVTFFRTNVMTAHPSMNTPPGSVAGVTIGKTDISPIRNGSSSNCCLPLSKTDKALLASHAPHHLPPLPSVPLLHLFGKHFTSKSSTKSFTANRDATSESKKFCVAWTYQKKVLIARVQIPCATDKGVYHKQHL